MKSFTPLDEIYILLESFSVDVIDLFRKHYLKDFEEVAAYYEYPPYRGQTQFETGVVDEMISFMLQGNRGYFRFYFRNPAVIEVFDGMIFFNNDNTLTLGVSVLPEFQDFYINKLKKDFNSAQIMVCHEVPPPRNREDFIKIINKN